jgi:hypothetical protein
LSALNYYVYYKFDPARIADLRTVVEKLFMQIDAATGIQGEWQRRRDDPSTFMETYASVTDGTQFDRALAGAIEQSGFADLGIQRVTEIFQCA